MKFRVVRNDSGSRFKWPILRRKNECVELMIDAHDADRLLLRPGDRVMVEVAEDECAVMVYRANPDDHMAWRVFQNKGGDIKIVMGCRALGFDIVGTLPAISVSIETVADGPAVLMKFDPKGYLAGEESGLFAAIPSCEIGEV